VCGVFWCGLRERDHTRMAARKPSLVNGALSAL
jgi:hypothetical protein